MSRTFVLLLLAVGAMQPVAADEPGKQPAFGTYGYLHGLLHHHGVIAELLRRTGLTCCDGGMGGECRGTLIRRAAATSQAGQSVQYEFLHGQTWCPVTSQVWFDIHFPDAVLQADINAVVCARRTAPHVCPTTTFCSAVHPAPG